MILNAKQIINFTSKITLDKTTGCWNWNGCKSAKGYGRFQLLGKTYNAHRISYVIHGGTLLTGKEIDHKCRNRSCVNPFHLQQISHKENVLIGESLQAKNKRKLIAYAVMSLLIVIHTFVKTEVEHAILAET